MCCRFQQRGFCNWLLLSADDLPGGDAASIHTAEGFRFDCGFKTLSTRFDYFDKFLEKTFKQESGKSLHEEARDNYVFIRDRMVRYPVQNNLGLLPSSERDSCLLDLIKSKLATLDNQNCVTPANLDEYLVAEWGEALCDIFFRPYLLKMWAYPTHKLSFDWVKWKIAPANFGDDFDRLLKKEQKDPGK